MLPITAYADRYFGSPPARPSRFKVSSAAAEDYEARLVRVISGDPNPDGPGHARATRRMPAFAGSYPSRVQPIHSGSYVRVAGAEPLDSLRSFTVTAVIWPTLPALARRQGRRVTGRCRHRRRLHHRDRRGGLSRRHLERRRRDEQGKRREGASRPRLVPGSSSATTADKGELALGQQPLAPAMMIDDSGVVSTVAAFGGNCAGSGDLLFAARTGPTPCDHYNGKLEGPRVLAAALDPDTAFQTAGEAPDAGDASGRRVGTSPERCRRRVSSTPGPHAMHGETVNLPTRAMKGSRWTGEEMCWRHAPEHYGAIYFHDDDLYDCGWETDFSFEVPEDLKSGVYAVRLRAGEDEDMVPFFVRAALGAAPVEHLRAHPHLHLHRLMPTPSATGPTTPTASTWRAGGARPWTPDEHPEYGISTYNHHPDGTGVRAIRRGSVRS